MPCTNDLYNYEYVYGIISFHVCPLSINPVPEGDHYCKTPHQPRINNTQVPETQNGVALSSYQRQHRLGYDYSSSRVRVDFELEPTLSLVPRLSDLRLTCSAFVITLSRYQTNLSIGASAR